MKNYTVTINTTVMGVFSLDIEAENKHEAEKQATKRFGKGHGFRIVTIKEM